MKVKPIHFETIPSTNTWSKENTHLFDKDEITLVTADSQTAGRGRFKRQWVSPPHQNIYATFNFFVNPSQTSVGNLPQILALSIVDTLFTLNVKATLKWPNDVLLSGKKAAGILCETVLEENSLLCVILGVGLNVNMPLKDLETIDRPATSLFAEAGKIFAISEILSLLVKNFTLDLQLFLEKGFAPFHKKFCKNLCHKKNELLSFHDQNRIWKGLYHSISKDGSLNLRLQEDLKIKNFYAGEILL